MVHPTQKPLPLIKWCINLAEPIETILDPFMGSGTTLRAAKDLGRKAIGIEIEKKYCDIAIERLRQGVLL
jgi:DNA modification methylase